MLFGVSVQGIIFGQADWFFSQIGKISTKWVRHEIPARHRNDTNIQLYIKAYLLGLVSPQNVRCTNFFPFFISMASTVNCHRFRVHCILGALAVSKESSSRSKACTYNWVSLIPRSTVTMQSNTGGYAEISFKYLSPPRTKLLLDGFIDTVRDAASDRGRLCSSWS